MYISVDNVSIDLDIKEVTKLRSIVPEADDQTLFKTTTSGLQHILDVCSITADSPPVLLDIHVFLASKLLEDPSAPVDREVLSAVLDAWREAESQLQPEARKALRLLEPLVVQVLDSKNKKLFEEAFHARFVPRLSLRTATFLRSYVEVMQEWADGGKEEGTGHYLENVVTGIYHSAIGSPRKQSDFVKKRLSAAKEALDSYIFE